MSDAPAAAPVRATLSTRHAIALCVGIIIGAGIFRTPSLVAANSSGEFMFLAVWVAGGLLSIVGALCYAELASAYPGVGGDYSYLRRAFGARLGFVHAWARLSVIQTGSIALLAFICGDYLAQVAGLGPVAATLFAAATVVLLTAINWIGTRFGTGTQMWLTVMEAGGLLLVAVVGFVLLAPEPAAIAAVPPDPATMSLGLAMVFVLLTFGGWSETVYVTAELKGGRRRILGILVAGLVIVTLLYVAANAAFLHALGLQGLAESEAVAAEVMQRALGVPGAALMAAIVAIAALTSANATVITGARTAQALGASTPALAWFGRWDERRAAPANALLAQGAVSLLLVLAGGFTRNGFENAVEYTAPVFWFFMLAVGIALFVLRRRDPHRERPFRVPLYPITPLVFCATSAYLLWSSLAYTGAAALFGVAVLAVGALLALFVTHSPDTGPDTGPETGPETVKEFTR